LTDLGKTSWSAGEAGLRWAQADDVENLVRLINAAFVVERFFLERDRINPEKVRMLMVTGKFLLAEDAAGLAGCVYIELRGARSYLGLLSVDPERQRSGVGRRLMAAAEDHCRSAGSRAMDLRVVNLRAELPPFYRRLGYAETGTAPFAADAQPSRPCHFIEMSKRLV
jgi:GNAT superfamily N-acetyltransferase